MSKLALKTIGQAEVGADALQVRARSPAPGPRPPARSGRRCTTSGWPSPMARFQRSSFKTAMAILRACAVGRAKWRAPRGFTSLESPATRVQVGRRAVSYRASAGSRLRDLSVICLVGERSGDAIMSDLAQSARAPALAGDRRAFRRLPSCKGAPAVFRAAVRLIAPQLGDRAR